MRLHLALLSGSVLCAPVTAGELRVRDALLVAGPAPAVTFRVEWEDGWRDARNHDAAWVFVKLRTDERGWQHARLAPLGHTVVAGAPPGAGGPDGSARVPPDLVGAFLVPSVEHRGPVRWDVRLALAPGSVAEGATPEVRVLALEMVAIPAGPYDLGDPHPDAQRHAAFYRSGPDGSVAGRLRLSSEDALEVAPEPGALWYRPTESLRRFQYEGDQLGPVPAEFPKGVRGFYLQKYEITQGEYAAFLDTLAEGAAGFRAIHAVPGYREGRGTLRLDGRRFVADAPWRPCNWISWDDGCAFADWAGLRPMTELEFTKACRGPGEPVERDYPWGTATQAELLRRMGADDELVRTGEADESLLDAASRARFGASYYWCFDLAGSVWERCVTIGHPLGRRFRGTHGDGRTRLGHATNEDWPRGDVHSGGFGYRGGGYYTHAMTYDPAGFNPYSPVEFRRFGAWGEAPRSVAYGFRCARTMDGG